MYLNIKKNHKQPNKNPKQNYRKPQTKTTQTNKNTSSIKTQPPEKQTTKNKTKAKFSSYLQRNSTNFFRVAQSLHLEVDKCVTENRD